MKRTLPFLFGFSFLIAALLSSVAAVVFDHGFYLDLYENISLSETTGVSDEQLQDSILMMTDYVEGKRDDLDGTVHWQGEDRETFNAKEKKHMVDVRTLWRRAKIVMILSWIIAISCVLLLAKSDGWKAVSLLLSGLKQALAVLAVVLLFFGFWYFIDFTGLWTWFHHVFFAGNDDWLLNPATDFMIVICPEQMFSTMIAQIAGKLIASILGVWIALYVLSLQSREYLRLRKIG